MPLPLIPLIIGGAATAIGGIAAAATTKSVADRVESARYDYNRLYSTYENIVGVLNKTMAACEPMYPLVPNWNRFVNASPKHLESLSYEDQKLIAETVKNVKNLKISSQLSRELDLSGTEDKVACFIATGIFNIIPGLGSALLHSMADDEIERIEQASAQIKREIKEIKSMLDEHYNLIMANRSFRHIREEWDGQLKKKGFFDSLTFRSGRKQELVLPDYAPVDEAALLESIKECLKSISEYVS